MHDQPFRVRLFCTQYKYRLAPTYLSDLLVIQKPLRRLLSNVNDSKRLEISRYKTDRSLWSQSLSYVWPQTVECAPLELRDIIKG